MWFPTFSVDKFKHYSIQWQRDLDPRSPTWRPILFHAQLLITWNLKEISSRKVGKVNLPPPPPPPPPTHTHTHTHKTHTHTPRCYTPCCSAVRLQWKSSIFLRTNLMSLYRVHDHILSFNLHIASWYYIFVTVTVLVKRTWRHAEINDFLSTIHFTHKISNQTQKDNCIWVDRSWGHIIQQTKCIHGLSAIYWLKSFKAERCFH